MRFLVLYVILFIQMTHGAQIEDIVTKVEQMSLNEVGKLTIWFVDSQKYLAEVQTGQIENIRDQSEDNQKKLSIKLKKLSIDCQSITQTIQEDLSQLDYQQVCSNLTSKSDSFSTLMNKKPIQERSIQRLGIKQDLLKELKEDLQGQIELRNTQSKLYNLNVDKLEKALFAITEIKKLFVRYIQNQAHRRRLQGSANMFLQDQGIDIESAMNEDFKDDVDNDDDLEERRRHYQVFVFVEITVGIKKLRESLQGLSGIEALMLGFEEIAATLHSIHTHDQYSHGLSFIEEGTNSEQTVEEIAQLVVDVSTQISDWIQQLRRWEDKTEDQKQEMSSNLQKMIQQHMSETQVEVDKLDGEAKSLTLSVNNLQNKKDNSQQRFQSQKVELNDRQTECSQQQFEFNRDLDNWQNP